MGPKKTLIPALFGQELLTTLEQARPREVGEPLTRAKPRVEGARLPQPGTLFGMTNLAGIAFGVTVLL